MMNDLEAFFDSGKQSYRAAFLNRRDASRYRDLEASLLGLELKKN